MSAASPFSRAPQRQRVLQYIRDECAAGREFPSPEAICSHMGWKRQSSAKACLSTLAGLDRKLERGQFAGATRYWLPPEKAAP